MTRKIKVSRHGLTRCPSCLSHIQLAADARLTACPFCEASLLATPEPAVGKLGTLIQGALATGRSGLLAASLLGLSVGVGACADEEDPEPSTDTQSTDAADTSDSSGVDTEPQPAYGIPADIIEQEDTNGGALYGGPPDTTSEDITSQPAYGIPADVIEQEDAPDTTSEALYGIPADTSP